MTDDTFYIDTDLDPQSLIATVLREIESRTHDINGSGIKQLNPVMHNLIITDYNRWRLYLQSALTTFKNDYRQREIPCSCRTLCGDVSEEDDHPQAVCVRQPL